MGDHVPEETTDPGVWIFEGVGQSGDCGFSEWQKSLLGVKHPDEVARLRKDAENFDDVVHD
jgi:hypothetical protein